jgi:hypothetical protein
VARAEVSHRGWRDIPGTGHGGDFTSLREVVEEGAKLGLTERAGAQFRGVTLCYDFRTYLGFRNTRKKKEGRRRRKKNPEEESKTVTKSNTCLETAPLLVY